MRKSLVVVGILMIVAYLFMVPVAFGADTGLQESNFSWLAKGGFGDSANSYSWGMTWFGETLYVGTVRHHLWSLLQQLPDPDLLSLYPTSLMPAPPSNTSWGDPEYANAMRAEIWAFNSGKWRQVFKSPTFELQQDIIYSIPGFTFTIPKGTYPVSYGYRAFGEFNGYLYALGVGTWVPPMASSSIIRTKNGTTWEDVTGVLGETTDVRAIVKWQGKVFVAATVPVAGGVPGLGGKCVVFGSADPKKAGWTAVNVPGFGGSNAQIYELAVFNNNLYASTVNLQTGFEVWKTDGSSDPANPGKYLWKQVIKNGFGDTWNQFGMSMQVFGNYLYVGTAVGSGMVLKNMQVVGSRPFELIRLDKNDNAELIVGATKAFDPIEGGPEPRIPRSGLSAGFGNPFNVYAWHMGVFQGQLYLGTLDLGGFLTKALAEKPEVLELIPSLLNISSSGLSGILSSDFLQDRLVAPLSTFLYDHFGGGELWRSADGIHWIPVTLNGFGNPKNYGIRRIVPFSSMNFGNVLAIGTANPFTGLENGGCEVLIGQKR